MSTPRFSKESLELQRELAYQYAAAYCENNGLSIKKLKKQRFQMIQGIAVFAQPSGVKPSGLTNDIATQPFPTLIIKLADGGLTVETTEHTLRYLK